MPQGRVAKVRRADLQKWCDAEEVEWTPRNKLIFRQLVELSELHYSFPGVNWTLDGAKVTAHKWLRWTTNRYIKEEEGVARLNGPACFKALIRWMGENVFSRPGDDTEVELDMDEVRGKNPLTGKPVPETTPISIKLSDANKVGFTKDPDEPPARSNWSCFLCGAKDVRSP